MSNPILQGIMQDLSETGATPDSEKSALEASENEFASGIFERICAFARSFSLHPVIFSPSCCSGEIELTFSAIYGLSGQGFSHPDEDASKGDLFVISGPLNPKFADMLRESYLKSVSKVYVMAVGSCAIEANIFHHTGMDCKLDDIVPVDIYVPGCPPSPSEIINGLRKLQKKIRRGYQGKRHILRRSPGETKAKKPSFPSDNCGQRISYEISSVALPGFEIESAIRENVACDIIIHRGFSFRGIEHELIGKPVLSAFPYVARIDYVQSSVGEILFVRYLEKVLNIKTPEKCQYLQTLVLEILRISSHLRNLAALARYFNSSSLAVEILLFEEKIRAMLELLSGRRFAFSLFFPGGVLMDLNEAFLGGLDWFVTDLFKLLRVIDTQLFGRFVIRGQLVDLGIIGKKQAIKHSLTGPNLRATGINMDCRKDSGVYKDHGFRPILGRHGDSWDRFYVRFREIYQSLDIIRALLKNMPRGEVRVSANDLPELMLLSSDTGYVGLESARGELGLKIGLKEGTVSEFSIQDPSSYVVDMIDHIDVNVGLDDLELFFLSFDIDIIGVDK